MRTTRTTPYGFADARRRQPKRSNQQIRREKQVAAEKREAAEDARRRARADAHRGPEEVESYCGIRAELCEVFGLKYRAIPAPQSEHQLQALVAMGDRITAENRSIAAYAPISFEAMLPSAA